MNPWGQVMNNDPDIVTGEKYNGIEVKPLNKLTAEVDLHEGWRMKRGNEREYTWSRNQPLTATRLDNVFMSASVTSNVEHCEIISSAHSDHRAVEIGISFHDFKNSTFVLEISQQLT